MSGGSVRIRDPKVQRKVLELSRAQYMDTFEPLLALLEKFDNTGSYSAGGAIGLERMSLIATKEKHISNTQVLPWSKDGTPPFAKKGFSNGVKK